MSKWIKTCLTVLAVAVMVFAFSFGCFAANGTVTYTGNSGDFIFAPGGKESPTDLFPNFKGVMPGDKLTQRIVVKNDANKKVDVEIFLKSLGAKDDSKDFLEKLSLSVKEVGGKELANGTAAEASDLSKFVSLGKFPSGSTTDLEVTLKVPSDLSDKYANAIGKLLWQFKVEEKPVKVPVKTGDTSNLYFYIAVFAAAAVTFTLLIVLKRKKRV